ncbi:hypothetical protein GQ53DRAFT_251067 [Thozetella sp. PMI_491]|nr:hypothetical protein GQ53DRAFT_251067 [Thozetella sp. PMI_491]
MSTLANDRQERLPHRSFLGFEISCEARHASTSFTDPILAPGPRFCIPWIVAKVPFKTRPGGTGTVEQVLTRPIGQIDTAWIDLAAGALGGATRQSCRTGLDRGKRPIYRGIKSRMPSRFEGQGYLHVYMGKSEELAEAEGGYQVGVPRTCNKGLMQWMRAVKMPQVRSPVVGFDSTTSGGSSLRLFPAPSRRLDALGSGNNRRGPISCYGAAMPLAVGYLIATSQSGCCRACKAGGRRFLPLIVR